MALIELKVPDIGDFKDVEVIEVLVKPGDTITAEQSLITIESDKASMEIPASQGGVIKDLKVKLGDKLNEGSVLALIDAADGAASPPTRPFPINGKGEKRGDAPDTLSPGERGQGLGEEFATAASRSPSGSGVLAGARPAREGAVQQVESLERAVSPPSQPPTIKG